MLCSDLVLGSVVGVLVGWFCFAVRFGFVLQLVGLVLFVGFCFSGCLLLVLFYCIAATVLLSDWLCLALRVSCGSVFGVWVCRDGCFEAAIAMQFYCGCVGV